MGGATILPRYLPQQNCQVDRGTALQMLEHPFIQTYAVRGTVESQRYLVEHVIDLLPDQYWHNNWQVMSLLCSQDDPKQDPCWATKTNGSDWAFTEIEEESKGNATESESGDADDDCTPSNKMERERERRHSFDFKERKRRIEE